MPDISSGKSSAPFGWPSAFGTIQEGRHVLSVVLALFPAAFVTLRSFLIRLRFAVTRFVGIIDGGDEIISNP